LAKVAIERAKAGDGPLLKSLIERLSPPQRNRSVRINLPALDDIKAISKALGSVSQSVADGTITPDEGHTIAGILEARRKSFETIELEARIANLEQDNGGKRP
jgi:translation elongation factor EF-Tu-like GTPase